MILDGGGPCGCPTGQVCCFGGASMCAATSAQCDDASVTVECNKGSDCSGGQVCCTPASGIGAVCQAAPCASGSPQWCATDAECPTGQSCMPAGFFNLSICQSADGGFPVPTGDGGGG
jgi:Cys-rich repeat protein